MWQTDDGPRAGAHEYPRWVQYSILIFLALCCWGIVISVLKFVLSILF